METLDSILEENAATDDLVTMLMMVSLPNQEVHLLFFYLLASIYIYKNTSNVLAFRSTMRSPRILPKGSTSKCRVPLISCANFFTFKCSHSSFNTLSSHGDIFRVGFFIVLMVIFKDNVFYHHCKCTNLLNLASVYILVFLAVFCTVNT